jgi:hypothetical protein
MKEENEIKKEHYLLQETYKNIEISEFIYLEKFEELRKIYWGL